MIKKPWNRKLAILPNFGYESLNKTIDKLAQARNLQASRSKIHRQVVKLTFIAAPLNLSSHTRYQNATMFPI
jgi:hypothetical protein